MPYLGFDEHEELFIRVVFEDGYLGGRK